MTTFCSSHRYTNDTSVMEAVSIKTMENNVVPMYAFVVFHVLLFFFLSAEWIR